MLKLKFKPGDDVFVKVKVKQVYVREDSITYECAQLDDEGVPILTIYAKEDALHEQDSSFIY